MLLLCITEYPYVNSIALNKDECDYYALFNKCTEKGMMVKGFSIKLVNESPTIRKEIPVIIK